MENKPGTGYTSPFGDEQGATVAGGGSSTGAHDFLTDPKSHAPTTGGRNFTKESRPQSGGTSDVNQESVPAGGPLPFPQADANANSRDGVGTVVGSAKHQPFRLSGANVPSPHGHEGEPPMTEAGSVPDEPTE